MDKRTLVQATITAIGITLRRLGDRIATDPMTDAVREHAIDEAITTEIGAALIATSFARELGWDAQALMARKTEILQKIEDAPDATSFDVITFLTQRDNANNN